MSEPRKQAVPRIVPDILIRHDPPESGSANDPVPVVFDSPHSGNVYPADFDFAAPVDVIRRAEDAFVDELFASAPAHGASLLAALFPRSYVDANRHEHEVDTLLLNEPWPHPIVHTHRSARGLGVVRRLVRATVPVYDRRLSVTEVQARIARYHRPYHEELQLMLDDAHGRFGAVWHLNCHSMKSTAKGRLRADFVLGDRDGTSCDPAFTDLVATCLREFGYSVGLNHPFKGAEIVIRHGDPAADRHSLQIEINRGLYMNEERIERSGGFDRLRADIDRLIAAIAGYCRERVTTQTARPESAPRDCAPDRTAG
jgi:N-formylglutamate amidohydrolase